MQDYPRDPLLHPETHLQSGTVRVLVAAGVADTTPEAPGGDPYGAFLNSGDILGIGPADSSSPLPRLGFWGPAGGGRFTWGGRSITWLGAVVEPAWLEAKQLPLIPFLDLAVRVAHRTGIVAIQAVSVYALLDDLAPSAGTFAGPHPWFADQPRIHPVQATITWDFSRPTPAPHDQAAAIAAMSQAARRVFGLDHDAPPSPPQAITVTLSEWSGLAIATTLAACCQAARNAGLTSVARLTIERSTTPVPHDVVAHF
jgi:hypothetical protein